MNAVNGFGAILSRGFTAIATQRTGTYPHEPAMKLLYREWQIEPIFDSCWHALAAVNVPAAAL
jgi:hypothetical protein